MKTETYNPLDMLNSQEEVNAYLNLAFLDDDPKVFLLALGYVAKKHGMSKLAQESGLNRESLYKTFSAQGNPRWETLSKVLHCLNIKLQTYA
ncbi:MAG: putative addiction module antidote protein [Mariprofundaceae bacterium]|nr:putative addiction module antidote protein [Mariprofundaceae bacterium]